MEAPSGQSDRTESRAKARGGLMRSASSGSLILMPMRISRSRQPGTGQPGGDGGLLIGKRWHRQGRRAPGPRCTGNRRLPVGSFMKSRRLVLPIRPSTQTWPTTLPPPWGRSWAPPPDASPFAVHPFAIVRTDRANSANTCDPRLRRLLSGPWCDRSPGAVGRVGPGRRTGAIVCLSRIGSARTIQVAASMSAVPPSDSAVLVVIASLAPGLRLGNSATTYGDSAGRKGRPEAGSNGAVGKP